MKNIVFWIVPPLAFTAYVTYGITNHNAHDRLAYAVRACAIAQHEHRLIKPLDACITAEFDAQEDEP